MVPEFEEEQEVDQKSLSSLLEDNAFYTLRVCISLGTII